MCRVKSCKRDQLEIIRDHLSNSNTKMYRNKFSRLSVFPIFIELEKYTKMRMSKSKVCRKLRFLAKSS